MKQWFQLNFCVCFRKYCEKHDFPQKLRFFFLKKIIQAVTQSFIFKKKLSNICPPTHFVCLHSFNAALPSSIPTLTVRMLIFNQPFSFVGLNQRMGYILKSNTPIRCLYWDPSEETLEPKTRKKKQQQQKFFILVHICFSYSALRKINFILQIFYGLLFPQPSNFFHNRSECP